jgi:hypothetical protein
VSSAAKQNPCAKNASATATRARRVRRSMRRA